MNSNEKAKKQIQKALFNPDNKLALIPNWLSFSRVIGSYAIPIMIYIGAPAVTLFSTVGFIAISDFLDGKIARFLKVDSEEGALIDAISDKFFSINLILGILPKAPIFAINGLLESQISYINAKAYSEGKNPKSSLLGKIKIWPLSIGLGLGYLSIAMKTQGINIINPSNVMLVSSIFSASTIPFELINIRQYQEAANREIDMHKEDKQTEIKEDKKEDKKNFQKNISLNKNKNIKLIVYETIKEEEKTKGKQKRLL